MSVSVSVCMCVCVREREWNGRDEKEREKTSKVSRDMKGFMVYMSFVIVVRMIGGCERNTFIYIYKNELVFIICCHLNFLPFLNYILFEPYLH